jgi:hypothetical protein
MYPTTLSGDGAAFGNHPASSIVATTSQASPVLVDWDETDRFLSLLGRSPESVDPLSVHGILYPQDKKKKAFPFFPLTPAGRLLAEKKLSSPEFQRHSLGIRINPGGTKATQITEGVALFAEADGGLPIEAQAGIPGLLGLPEPTFTTWTGGKSLHLFWVAKEGMALPPEEWKEAQKRLISAIKEVAPEAKVDEGITFPNAVMRAPGGLHPATGERSRIHSESGERFDLAALVEMLPQPVRSFGPSKFQKMWEERTGELQNLADLGKATDALAYLPPEHFTGYMPWLGVGMALHSVTPALFDAWMFWSKGMGDAFDEEECRAKWETFSVEREDGVGLGSLIRLAKNYGYHPPAAGQDTSSRHTALPSESPSVESKDRGFATADTPSRLTAGVSGMSGVSGMERKSVRALSVQERMELMRETVATLLQDGTTRLDRLPVLRERASQLDLPLRDGELSKLVWEARRALTAPAEALSTGDLLDFTPIPWCWEGLLMREAINLLIAAPKVGKTSLLIAAIAAWYRGESFLGKQFYGECPPVLIVGSDQPQSDWGRMLQKEGLVSEERRLLAPIVGLFHSGTPLSLDPEGIEKIATYAKEHPGLLVVIDSYARCVASLGLSERDAEIAGPLADLQEAVAPYGATIVGIHHANKGGHESASMASRGSSALPALASQLVHLTRLEQGQEGSMGGKRMLTTEGRGGAPEKMLLELSEEGQWLFRGDGDALLQEQERQRTIGALNDRQASALEHVEETWEESEGRIGLSATVLASLMELRGADPSRVARRLLEQLRERGLVQRKVINLGMSTGGLATHYVPATADTFTPTADIPDTADTPAVKREEVSGRSETPSMDSKDAEVGEFESVQTFQDGQWSNGWMVEKCTKTLAGTFFTLFREDDPSQVASLHQSFVRPCAS